MGLLDMLQVMPNWYGELTICSFFIGIFGILPSMLLEVMIWGTANGNITLWSILLAILPLMSSVIFKDFRDYIFSS